MNIYVASSLLNAAEVNRAYAILEERGLAITYKWTDHGLVTEVERCKEICQLEINGVISADALLFLHPARTGSHVELGIALALGIPIFMVFPEQVTDVEMKTFYYDECVKWSKSLEEATDQIDTYPLLKRTP